MSIILTTSTFSGKTITNIQMFVMFLIFDMQKSLRTNFENIMSMF